MLYKRVFVGLVLASVCSAQLAWTCTDKAQNGLLLVKDNHAKATTSDPTTPKLSELVRVRCALDGCPESDFPSYAGGAARRKYFPLDWNVCVAGDEFGFDKVQNLSVSVWSADLSPVGVDGPSFSFEHGQCTEAEIPAGSKTELGAAPLLILLFVLAFFFVVFGFMVFVTTRAYGGKHFSWSQILHLYFNCAIEGLFIAANLALFSSVMHLGESYPECFYEQKWNGLLNAGLYVFVVFVTAILAPIALAVNALQSQMAQIAYENAFTDAARVEDRTMVGYYFKIARGGRGLAKKSRDNLAVLGFSIAKCIGALLLITGRGLTPYVNFSGDCAYCVRLFETPTLDVGNFLIGVMLMVLGLASAYISSVLGTPPPKAAVRGKQEVFCCCIPEDCGNNCLSTAVTLFSWVLGYLGILLVAIFGLPILGPLTDGGALFVSGWSTDWNTAPEAMSVLFLIIYVGLKFFSWVFGAVFVFGLSRLQLLRLSGNK